MLLAPLLLTAFVSAHDFIDAFERADAALLNAMWSEQAPRDRRLIRRVALDPRFVNLLTAEADRVCVDVRERGGMLLDQYEVDLRDGSIRSVAGTEIGRARAGITRGEELLFDGKLDEAEAAFDAAVTTTHPQTRAAALHGLGHVAYVRNDLETATRHLQQTYEIGLQAKDRFTQAMGLEGLAAVDRFRGDLDRAEARLTAAMQHMAEVDDRLMYAWMLSSYGYLRSARGDYRGAERAFRDSLALAEETGETTVQIVATLNLGNNARLLGRYRDAQSLLLRALEMSEADDDLPGIAGANANLGTVLAALGQLGEAVQRYQTGLELKERLGHGESIILELSSLGETYRRLGNEEQARAQFEKGLALARKAGFKTEIAHGLHNLGKFEQALAIDREIGNRAGIARDLQSIGRARSDRAALEESLRIAEEIGAKESMTTTLALLSQLDGNIETARRALAIAEDLGLPEHLWYAHLILGRALRGNEARREFERSIAVVEELRRAVPGADSARQQAFERMVEPYHELIALLVQQGDRKTALAYAERAKARVLLDVLQNGRPDIGGMLSEEERAREAELTARIAELHRSGATKKLRTARLEYDAFLTNVYARHPQLQREAGEIVTTVDVDEPFVEFVVTKERTFAFTNSRAVTIEISERELASEVAKFRKLLASRDLLYESASRALYDRLLGKLHLRPNTTICIVPDGPLWELPFHALQSGDEYLLDRHAIHYAPSLSVLREMTARSRDARAKRLLAVANPALSHTASEIQAIGSLYSDTRLRPDAREELVKKEAGAFDVLHFATHGVLDDQNALYSHLVFSRSPHDDGLLEAREIMRLDLRARLAVLSACETARGRIRGGEGMIGMSWALFVAGVPSTVASQWKVDSTSTTELMIEFHRNLRAGLGNAEALRRAAMKTRETYRHPFYWAPFVVVGSAR